MPKHDGALAYDAVQTIVKCIFQFHMISTHYAAASCLGMWHVGWPGVVVVVVVVFVAVVVIVFVVVVVVFVVVVILVVAVVVVAVVVVVVAVVIVICYV